jgi:hypothetical protein
MFLRQMIRKKDGKERRYFSVVENKRVADGRVVQRQVLYLGEINDTQQLSLAYAPLVLCPQVRLSDGTTGAGCDGTTAGGLAGSTTCRKTYSVFAIHSN